MQKQYLPHIHFKNEQLFLLSGNKYLPIKHDSKITHFTCLGEYLCFSNEKNEIFKVSENDNNNGEYENIGMVPSNNKIKFFISGFDHLLVILENNLIYKYGMLDDDEDSSIIDKLKLIKNDFVNNITHACCGTYCGIIVDNFKTIYSIGKIDRFLSSEEKLERHSFNFGIIKNISCGYGHVIVLNSNGEIYGFGLNDYGQLNGYKSDNEIIDSQFEKYTKINYNFINNRILDAFAIPLSHLTVIVTVNYDVFVFGYLGFKLGYSFNNNNNTDYSQIVKLKQSCLQNDVKELNCITGYKVDDLENNNENNNYKFNYEKKELSIYGGFTSIIFVNQLKRKVWLGGWRENHFTDEIIYLKEEIGNDIMNGGKDVINVSCGSTVVGILIGDSYLNNDYMFTKLKIMSNICCKNVELMEESNDIPLSDIVIKF